MKSATSTQLRKSTAEVFNSLFKNGQIIITHRDRPDMILITKECLDSKIHKAWSNGVDGKLSQQ